MEQINYILTRDFDQRIGIEKQNVWLIISLGQKKFTKKCILSECN